MKIKNWVEQSVDTLTRRYSEFLRMLWHNGYSNLNQARLFRNKKGTKEKIKVGKKIFNVKLNKKRKVKILKKLNPFRWKVRCMNCKEFDGYECKKGIEFKRYWSYLIKPKCFQPKKK